MNMQETMSFTENNGENNGAVLKSVTGRLYTENGKFYVYGDCGETIEVDGAVPNGYKDGDKVALDIKAEGVVFTENFGPSAEAEPNLKAMLRRGGFDKPFEADALMEAKAAAFTEITARMAKRTDLRGKTIITLSETENSRTECGFSVELDKENHYILGIHTVDVAEFVDKGSPLEKAIFSRRKTVMLPSREIPMLPESLTKGPCFLEVGADRLAVSYFLTVDENGNVLSFDFCESVINTAANCLFGEIEALFLDYDTSAIMPLRKAYASVFPTIANMFSLGAALQNARAIRGGADIDKAKRYFLYSRHGGKPIGIAFRKDSDPRRLIREFLSVAGQELAAALYKNDMPCLYRVQAEPAAEAIARFRNHAELVGVDTEPYGDKELFAAVADSIRGIREEELLLSDLHSLLPETDFDQNPHTHFIHNTDMYTRFAYPLNRCADFAMQRIVKAVIAKSEQMDLLREKSKESLLAAKGEKDVNRCEKQAEDLVALDCLKRDREKDYCGLVKSITADGVTLLLNNGCVGKLTAESVEKLNAADETAVIGGKLCRFGTELKVRFSSVDFESATLYVDA